MVEDSACTPMMIGSAAEKRLSHLDEACLPICAKPCRISMTADAVQWGQLF